MFTVVICNRALVDDCKTKYAIYLKPFLEKSGYAFCRWDPKGTTLQEAVPELYDLTAHKKQWRALIVADLSVLGYTGIARNNPYNFVESTKPDCAFETPEEILAYRQMKQQRYERALENPLMRLSVWLCGASIRKEPQVAYLQKLPDVTEEGYFQAVEQFGKLPMEVEHDRLRLYRHELMLRNFSVDGELFNPPKQVIALGERILSVFPAEGDADQVRRTEFDYSRFYEDNLYPDRLRYMLFDVQYLKGARNDNHWFNFLTLLMVLATNEIPLEVMRPYRVYRVDANIDSEQISRVFNGYLDKLTVTLTSLTRQIKKDFTRCKDPVSDVDIRELMESDVHIPVQIRGDFPENELLAVHKKIGLASDCPEDEKENWDGQYHEISRKFLRFLREPRRAVKNAVIGPFRLQSVLQDERALQMNDYQREDVEYHLLDEEKHMVETSTTRLYETESYLSRMNQADENLRREMGQRMSRRKAVSVALVAALAYFIGFLPMIFGKFNDFNAVSFGITVTVISILLMMVVGLVFLIWKRFRLKRLFKAFNKLMRGLCEEIRGGLQVFSKYLSHACNVRREFSVLQYTEEEVPEKLKALRKHEQDIRAQIEEVYRLFAKHLDRQVGTTRNAEPYHYDFSRMEDYTYELPRGNDQRTIHFLQAGNEVTVPVNYVQAITLEREELYD